jgi:hypothetical protein
MSYFDPEDTHARWYGSYDIRGTSWGTTTESTGVYGNTPTTPMALDIAAAQLLYGAPVNSPLSGGQVFGFNTNITGAIRPFFDFTQNANPIVTLWDQGTNNTLDLSGFSTNSTVNLNRGAFSSCDGLTNNICIALNTKIDTFVGGAGNDTVTANNDGDTLFGGLGNDIFRGGVGNDIFDGGAGNDKAIYADISSNYTITHNPNGSVTVAGPGGTDTLTSIEKVVFNDQTISSSQGNQAVADFDGNGKSDILWQDDSGQAALWLLNGSTVTNSGLAGGNPGPSWHIKGSGDFDGDGKADILWQNDSGQAALWLMNGASETIGALVGSNPGPSWNVVSAADLDGDGKADILWQNDSGQAALWLMNGTSVGSTALLGSNPGPTLHMIAATS